MNSRFALFVALYLLIDLADPTVPGAFRFDPDESVLGTRVKVVRSQDLIGIPQTEPYPSVQVPQPVIVAPYSAIPFPPAPAILTLLPRRNPSSDQSSANSGEDA